MRNLIIFAAVPVVLRQYAKIIQNAQILVDDVLLCGPCILCSYNVQLLGALRTLKDELEEPDRRFARGGS